MPEKIWTRAESLIRDAERAVDRVIGFVSPERELNRVRSRIIARRLGKIERRSYYEAAKIGRRTEHWTTTTESVQDIVKGGASTLRARSRDLVRNNPWADKAIEVLQSDIVGTGIMPRPIDPAKNVVRNTRALWMEWAESTACDSDGVNNFYGMQSLMMRCIAESGSVLVRRRWRSDKNLPIPMQIQLLEPDYIDLTRDYNPTSSGQNRIINGIEFDPLGRRVAYWLYPELPGTYYSSYTSERIPADEIIHLYRIDRIGQVDGVPWGAPCIIRLRDLDEFEDAELIRKKIAACFAGFIHDAHELDSTYDTDDEKKELLEHLEPGMLQMLPPGKDIKFGVPPSGDGNTQSVIQYLRSIAAGYGVTYEALTGDYSQVNFSSGRMGWLQYYRAVDQWRWLMLIPRGCNGVWAWFNTAGSLSGRLKREIPAAWTAPRREMIDPMKETNAIGTQVSMGLKSLSEAIREQGDDPDEVFEEKKSDNEKLDAMGIVVTTDPRKTKNPEKKEEKDLEE